MTTKNSEKESLALTLYTVIAIHQDDTKEAFGVFLSHNQAYKAMCFVAGKRFKALKDADEDEDEGMNCLHLIIDENSAAIRWIEEDINDDIVLYSIVQINGYNADDE